MLQQSSRLGLFPLFVCGAAMAVLSPVFWLSTRLPSAPQARTYDNQALYERVYPAFHYTAERLGLGEWPLWNPWLLCGTEHLANPQNGVLQPLNLLFVLLPPPAGLAVHGFLCALLMAGTFLLFARSLGTRYAPGFLGACVYAFSGAAAAALSHPEYAAFLVWMPLCFWGVRAVMRRTPNGAPVLGVALALAFLSGAVDAFLAMALVLTAYAGYEAFLARRTAQPGERRGLRRALLLALGLSAAQWLPYVAWAWQHGGLFPEAAGGVQAALPATLRELLQQLLAVREDSLLPPLAYFGVVTLLVLPSALFHRQARKEVFFFLPAAALALLLVVYGRSGWDARLPFEAFAFPASFAIALLAALGADRLLETGRDPRSPNVWGPVLLALLTGAVSFYLLPAFGRGTAALFFVLALVPSVVVRLRGMAAAAAAFAVLLTFVDLTHTMAQSTLHPYADMPGAVAAHDRELRALQEQTLNTRALISTRPLDAGMPANAAALRGIRGAGAQRLPMTPEQHTWWTRLADGGGETGAAAGANAAQPRLLNFMAVRGILASPESPLLARKWGEGAPRLRAALSGGTMQVLVNDDALPRAFWVPTWRPAETLEAAMTILDAPDFRPAQSCVVEADADAVKALAARVPEGSVGEGGAPLACAIVEDQPESITLRVNSPAAGIVVLADTFAPGWRAEVNGARAPVLKVNGLFRGVAVDAGENTVVFRYRPRDFYVGLAISLLTAAALALLGLVRALRGPRQA